MRIIAGSKRRLPLKTVSGREVRPTSDRIKETLFNMIQDEIYGRYVLDLFAGSGQIGLEAVSRGACRFCGQFQKGGGVHFGKYPFYKIGK